MCGIAGYITFNRVNLSQRLLNSCKLLSHRGPDAQNISVFNVGEASIGLAHTRLAIIDLTLDGNQPMKSSSGNTEIVFNGEIYNYRELRNKLRESGYVFHTNSDTEVILACYECYGDSFVSMLNGMFAFVLIDKVKRQAILCRDRFGVKPFFYSYDGNVLVFGSELRAIRSLSGRKYKINKNALYEYLNYGYVTEAQCILTGVEKLLPGHYAVIDLNNRSMTKKQYWSAKHYFEKKNQEITYASAINRLEELLIESVQSRLISDVEVGLFLSGGYDSSLVAAIASKALGRKIQSFTIGFENQAYNEAPYALKVAKHLGLEHQELTCTLRQSLEIIPQLPYVYDEPFGDSSAIPTILVSKFARKRVKVSLSADGGDELFFGYRKYFNSIKLFNLKKKIGVFSSVAYPGLGKFIPMRLIRIYSDADLNQDIIRKALSAIKYSESPVDVGHIISSSCSDQTLLNKLIYSNIDAEYLKKYSVNNAKQLVSHQDQLSFNDIEEYLVSDILVKVDRATMSQGLEGREPLLNHQLFEFVATLPDQYKYRNGSGKFILKEITHKYIPDEIMNRPKMGFGIPVRDWMRAEMRGLFDEALIGNGLDRIPELNQDLISTVAKRYMNGDNSNFQLLWYVYNYSKWKEAWDFI